MLQASLKEQEHLERLQLHIFLGQGNCGGFGTTMQVRQLGAGIGLMTWGPAIHAEILVSAVLALCWGEWSMADNVHFHRHRACRSRLGGRGRLSGRGSGCLSGIALTSTGPLQGMSVDTAVNGKRELLMLIKGGGTTCVNDSILDLFLQPVVKVFAPRKFSEVEHSNKLMKSSCVDRGTRLAECSETTGRGSKKIRVTEVGLKCGHKGRVIGE